MNASHPRRICLPILLAAALAGPALAERADRDKPVNIEANRISVDEAKKIHVFEGNVQLVQGTLIIRTEKLVVTQDAQGFQKGVAYGGADGLARFRQKREAKNEYVDGEAERIEHDARSEKSELFVRAHVTSGLDEVRGQYIAYDGKTENYVVTGTPGGTAAAGGRQERVRAVIQPKNREARPEAAPARNDAAAKPAADADRPRQEN
jgi:lipopolysaccharide export system protein LptA